MEKVSSVMCKKCFLDFNVSESYNIYLCCCAA